MSRTLRFLAVLAALVAWAGPVLAQSALSPKRPDIKAELLVGEPDSVEPGAIWLGVRVKLGPGWKTYWRSPGESGLPSEFDWAKSENLAGADVLWPAPHRIEVLGVETVGYTDEVVFPVKARLRDANAPLRASLDLALYACSTICVREDETLTANFSPGERHPEEQAIIDRWRLRVPGYSSPALSITSIRLNPTDPPALEVVAKSTQPFQTPDLFVESEPPVFGGKPKIVSASDGSTIFTVPLEGEKAKDLRERSFRVTLVDGEHAVESSSGLAASPSPQAAMARAPDQRLWLMLGVALLGGFILNLMPCVFPVLSLKLLAFINRDAERLGGVRAGFAASAAGIVASFLALASAMVVLKALGATVGWGIQFQQPVFLAFMAGLLTLFAANLLGAFEIILPSRITETVAGIGRGTSLAGHFGSGFVATLLATPCSAPFVGTAVGFALARGAGEIYLVFAALGLGMALPYLAVVAVPRLATLLPRPGRWMLTVKRAMAAGLLATAAWLLVVIVGAPSQANDIAWRRFELQEVKTLVREGRTVLVDITAAWCITCKVNDALVLEDADVKRRLASDAVPVRGDWTKPDARIAAYLQSFGRFGIPFNVVYGPGAPAGIVLPELLTKTAVLAAFDQAAAGPTSLSSSN